METKDSKFLLCLLILIITVGVCLFVNTETVWAAAKDKPEITKITCTKDSVKVYFNKVSGAKSYSVYRKVNDGKFKEIAKLSDKANSYLDNKVKKNNKYIYKISARKVLYSREGSARGITPLEIKAPTLVSLENVNTVNEKYTLFTWKSIPGKTYAISKKVNNGRWQVIDTVKAQESLTTFVDDSIKKDTKCYYTCRVVDRLDKFHVKYGDYEKPMTAIEEKVTVKLDCQNLKSIVQWDEISGANEYKVYRKVGVNGKYRLIGTSNTTSFTDVYKDNAVTADEKSFLCAGTFVDPSVNPFVYTVRAINKSDNRLSYGPIDEDGEFHVEKPSIVEVKKLSPNTVEIGWGRILNATGYNIYSGYEDRFGKINWKLSCSVGDTDTVRQKAIVKIPSGNNYFTVRAVYKKNGKTYLSGYDTGYKIEKKSYENNNILFLGDSITYGSPYKSLLTKNVFSYAWRMQQLTGVRMYNPSIPGATYTYRDEKNRDRVVTQVAQQIRDGKTPYAMDPELDFMDNGHNEQKFKDFDVVVMTCGSNDYGDNIPMGDIDSMNIEEFNGAVNQILQWIKEGSDERVADGKAPIKVVFVELFYSDRTIDHSVLTNRFTTPNKLGYTLLDYQANLNKQVEKHRKDGMKIYEFDTTEFVDQNSCPYVTSDNLHMTRYTYGQIGNKFAKFLISEGIIN